MKVRIHHNLFFCFFLSFVIPAGFIYGGNDTRSPGQQQIIIESNYLEIDDLQNRVTFTGNVQAQRHDFKINCQKMDLYYHHHKTGDPDQPDIEIKQIVATGEVKIIRNEGGLATAETAIYLQGEEKIVLTGNPKIRQENDFVEGTRITLFLKEKKTIVEGSEESRVKAVVRVPESE